LTNNNKEIVLWGTNLNSSLGYGRLTKIVLEMYEIPSYHKSVIIGILLSDGWITYATPYVKSPRIGFNQSFEKFEYLWKVFIILSPFCNSLPKLIIGKRKETVTYALQFLTRSLPCLKPLREMFYNIEGKKIVPDDIYNLLDPISLAYWIMSDGSVSRHGLLICTDSFTIPDIVKLINVLIIKYQLECKIRYHTPTQPRIYISQKSMDLLIKVITPYIHTSMKYKLRKF
jgi:hypothetical protein